MCSDGRINDRRCAASEHRRAPDPKEGGGGGRAPAAGTALSPPVLRLEKIVV